MAEDWTEDWVREILRYLPVKSLIRFKTASKSWRALLENPKFAHDHLITTRKSSPTRLLINKIKFSGEIPMRILLPGGSNHNFSSSSVDLVEMFSHNEAAISSLVPSNMWSFRLCNGLFCYFDGVSSRVALANMATREFKLLPLLPLPQGLDDEDEDRTSKLLVVPVALAFHHSEFIFFGRKIMNQDLVCVQYAMYACSTNSWTVIRESSSVLSNISLRDSAFINGVYYWVWFRYSHGAAKIMILSFDVEGGSSVFREEHGPLMSYPTIANMSLFEYKNGVWLAVSYEVDHHNHLFCHDVWVMEGDGSWKKEFSIGPLSGMNRMLRLSNNGYCAADLAVLASVFEQLHFYDLLNGEITMDLAMEVDNGGAAGKIIDVFTYEESVVKLGSSTCLIGGPHHDQT